TRCTTSSRVSSFSLIVMIPPSMTPPLKTKKGHFYFARKGHYNFALTGHEYLWRNREGTDMMSRLALARLPPDLFNVFL
ncbi:MAG TPA: hypothetical protein VFW53_11460, partial [Gallionella sp.]|nr:hypothetical protein [Gallionella sp.]